MTGRNDFAFTRRRWRTAAWQVEHHIIQDWLNNTPGSTNDCYPKIDPD